MSARNSILGKLRAAPAAAAVEPDIAAFYAARPQRPLTAMIAEWAMMMRAVRTEVVFCREPDWDAALVRVVNDKQIGRLLLAPTTAHGKRAMDTLAAQPKPLRMHGYDRAIDEWKAELFNEVDAGFTSVRAGICSTGSLIAWPTPDEPRTMSLVPPVHIALFDASRMYDTLYQAMQVEGWKNGLPTNSLLISGPSKTSDIQQTVAYGAHGPRELIVLCVLPTDVSVNDVEGTAQ